MLKPRKGTIGRQVHTPREASRGGVHRCARSPFRGSRRGGRALLVACVFVLATLLGPGPAFGQTAPGTTITNVGQADYTDPGGNDQTRTSNADQLVVVILRTPSTIEFLKYGAGVPGATPEPIGPQTCSTSGTTSGPFVPSPPVTEFDGTPIDTTNPVPLVADGAYHAGEPVFVRLEDADQNLDAAVVEIAEVVLEASGGDQEVLRLSETGPDTGIFVGAIMSDTPPPTPGDCRISVGVDDTIEVRYTDPVDGTDASSDLTLVDPFGLVFDSATGMPVDGATITLWDVVAGAPATVVGDDGFSSFPSTIVSGGTATDSSGAVYDFGPGQYRFPFVSPGDYQLRVTPPAAYNHPSASSDAQLQSLPGAPYALMQGSRGETFVVPVGPAVQIDIPLDPFAAGLLVTKQAARDRVGEGEFVPYRVRISNGSGATVPGAVLVDRLPNRFRFEEGSGRIAGAAAADPEIVRDGRELRFALGDLAPNASVELEYVARVVPGAQPGEHVNRAFVEAGGGGMSNVAEASVRVVQDLFDQRSYLVGRIHIDGCDPDLDEPAEGLGNVRVYLEDGSFVVTDEEGRFHFEAISPGLHVVQLDLESIPQEYEIVDCDRAQRKAGRAFSEFVEIQPGTLWRSDFYVRRRVPESGVLSQRLTARIEEAHVDYLLELATDRLPARDVTAMLRLPEGLRLAPDSVRAAGRPVEARLDSGTWLLAVGDLSAGSSVRVELRAEIERRGEGFVETSSVVRARPEQGRPVTTPPTKLRFPLPARVEIAPATVPEPAHLEHRLLNQLRKGLVHYVLQIYVESELPEVIVAEVDLPSHQKLLDWTPRNERGVRVTTTQRGRLTRFVLPREASKSAVRVFLVGGVPKHVLQVFFTAEPKGPGEELASSRILPFYGASSAASSTALRETLRSRISVPQPAASPDSRVRAGQRADQSPAAGAASGAVEGPEPAPDRAATRTPAVLRAHSQVEIAASADASPSAQATSRAAPSDDPRAGAPVRGVDDPEHERAVRKRPETVFGAEWLATAPPGRGFVYPAERALPRIPSLKLGIQHAPNEDVELLLGGEPVSAVHFDGRIQNNTRTLALSRWRGVGLREGENRFVAIFRDTAGRELGRSERVVHLAGAPVRAVVVPEASTLVADGRTPPVIALRLFDRWGEPVREGSTGQLDLDPPYQTQEEVEAARKRPLAGIGFERPSFVVEDGGIARIRLHPTSVVGEARLRLQLREDREDEITAWLEPGDRDWVLVGLATGTLGWNEASGSRASRRADDAEEGLITEGRVAFFAKGRVPGRFLLTAAYDTDASNTRLRDRLFQTLEPDEHYTLYGDTTQRDFDAPTSGRLYVKIEKKRFYALYGDYQTGLESTELSRYARSFTGGKMEYRGRHFEANAFVTEADQAFVRDELQGDGTSGLYRLRGREILPGSEQVTIETRDRFRPEIVLSSEPQGRFTDYEIDYRDGTLFFRRPIPGQDENFDPIFIVVDYETDDQQGDAITGGGRIAGRAFDGRAEIGFTGIHEDAGELDSQLFGGDATFRLTDETELRGEFAHSRGADFSGSREDEAWLVELDHRGERLDLRAYAREQGEDFGLGQQRAATSALRSYGLDAGLEWTPTWRSESSLFRQENLSTEAERHVAELRTRWDSARFGANAGVRYSGDQVDGRTGHNVQLLGGGRADFFDGRFSLRAEGEAALREDRFGDFPHRGLFGADWKLHERLTLFADQEIAFGEDQSSADTRAGFRGAPWKGATVSTSVTQEQREFGPRTYANLGLQQRWDLFQHWGFDLSIDRVATIRDPGNVAFKPGNPAASGSFSDDYTAVSLGSAYREGAWSGTSRLEARFGENEDRWGFVAGVLRDQNQDFAWSGRFDLFHTNARSGHKELRSDTSLSLAYRPLRSHWIVLERLDLETRDTTGSDFDFESRKLVHHLKANQLLDRRTQLAWQLSNKLVIDTISGRSYTTFGTLAGLEVRKDFAEGWDMSMHGRVRHLTGGDEVSVGYGLSVGRILVDNVWLSLGYNLTGFYDAEFSGADYTAQGPFFRIRAKFDQLTVKQALQLFR